AHSRMGRHGNLALTIHSGDYARLDEPVSRWRAPFEDLDRGAGSDLDLLGRREALADVVCDEAPVATRPAIDAQQVDPGRDGRRARHLDQAMADALPAVRG